MTACVSAHTATMDPDLQALLQDTGVGIWRFEADPRRFCFDDTCRAMFDVDADASFGPELIRQRIHPEDQPGYWAAIRRAMAGEASFSIEYRILRRDGAIRWISARGRVHPGQPGEAVVVQGVCFDISERRQLEDSLHATELRLQALADSFPGLFCYMDRNYVVRFLSDRYIEHLGTDRRELIGRPLAELTGAARFREQRPIYDAVLAGKVHSFEDARRMPDGELRHYAISYQPDRGASGEVRGFMAIGLDITDLRRIEQALQERTRELSRSNRDLEQFAYAASHDLKAPLRAIEALVAWLREDLASHDSRQVQETLAQLAQRSSRLHQLLDDLLAYARAGHATSEASEVDSRQLVADIGLLLAPPPGMRVEADASLPVLRTWRAPLEQVLRNLVNNAIKHHPRREGLVRVYAERGDGGLVFAVEDDGAGIPTEFADKVFLMFQTAGRREGVEGSGMGLAIVKRIVEGQGGRIWFGPGRDGRGTVFRFSWKPLPAASAPREPRNLHPLPAAG